LAPELHTIPALSAAVVSKRLGSRLGGRVAFSSAPRGRDVTARLERADDLLEAVRELSGGLGMGLATVVATDERREREGDFKVRYVFEPGRPTGEPLADLFVSVVVSAGATRPEVPSLTPILPAADWHEREMRDLFGIEPIGHPDPRTLVLHDGWPAGLYPLRKDFDARRQPERLPAPEFPHVVVEGEGVFEIPVGPIHAGIIEPGHFRFSSVGETVLHLDARLFFTHRGLEKRVEGLTSRDAFFIAERLCGACSVSHALAFAEAVEQIAGVTAPPRARFLRVVALELERLYNHVGDIGNICAGASYHAGTSAGMRLKETLQRENERLTGNRFLRGFVVPGGVSHDGAARAAAIDRLARETGDRLTELMQALERNPSVVDRLDDTGILTPEEARDLGVTGVAARASGIDRDARRDHPHAAFEGPGAVVPRVSTDSGGDVHARITVRAAEATESVRLLRQLVASLPPGPLCAPLPDVLPAWRTGMAVVESPRGASIHWLRTDGAGRVDRYHVRSASYANWPAVPVAALRAIVPDFPLVNKSFELCYACTDR
jgi:Ni,Fe-hydrogenase III large subunit/Ni,Fe-hydrogenase III component G